MKRRIRPAVLPFGTFIVNGVILIAQFIRKIATATIDETKPVRPTRSAPGTRAALERGGHASADNVRRRGGSEVQQAGASFEDMMRLRLVKDAARQICEMVTEKRRAGETGATAPDPAVADQHVTDKPAKRLDTVA